MKKIFNGLLILGFALALFTNDHFLNLFHKNHQDVNEFYADLSARYYGTPVYGKSLAIINQAAVFQKGMTHSELIVPSREAIIRLYEHYNMTNANRILTNAGLMENKLQRLERHGIQKSVVFFPIGGVLLFAAGVFGYKLSHKK